MQTFLPLPDFEAMACVLDDRRLGRQRAEALMVMRALHREVYGWKRHPAVLMWEGYEEALGAYSRAICREWRARGFADTCEDKILAELPGEPRTQAELADAGALPPWLGDDAFHRSHRSALVRKLPEHYRAQFPDVGEVPDDLEYVWPVRAVPARPRRSAPSSG